MDVRNLDPEEVRSRMAVVSQSTYLFAASIRDNLRLARPQASGEQIENAAEQAGLLPFIQGLPQGFDTWVGEYGLRLSGGERQRLAIARAMLKDAPILILDEATANLDALTERQVLEAIAAFGRDRTVLMITHRLANIPVSAEILVMDQGRVAQRGRHADLLAQDGLYRRMWEIQQNLIYAPEVTK